MNKAAVFIPVFHAYIPLGHEGSIEERFLFEYLAEALYPLLRVFEGLENEAIDYGFTLSISPILAGMLENPAIMMRFEDYLDWRIAVAEAVVFEDSGKSHLLSYYLNKFKDLKYWHAERYRYQPLKAIFSLAALGHLEVIFSNAGNAVLPMIEGVKSAVAAEIRVSLSEFKHFSEGADMQGIWLTERAYSKGVEEILVGEGLEYCFVDESALKTSGAPVINGCAKPVVLENGLVALAINNKFGKKISLGNMAYCYDQNYAKTGAKNIEVLAGELLPAKLATDGISKNYLGVDLYTNGGGEYSPDIARDIADNHAAHYLSVLCDEVNRHKVDDGIVVVAIDHESVGTAWKELPVFIDMLLRKMRFDQDIIKASTPTRYLSVGREFQLVSIADSSSSSGGVFEEFYAKEREKYLPELHLAAKKLESDSLPNNRVVDQMARELILAQGCEWRFYAMKGIDEEYPSERQRKRLARFAACEQMLHTDIDYDLLSAIEQRCAVLSTAGAASFNI